MGDFTITLILFAFLIIFIPALLLSFTDLRKDKKENDDELKLRMSELEKIKNDTKLSESEKIESMNSVITNIKLVKKAMDKNIDTVVDRLVYSFGVFIALLIQQYLDPIKNSLSFGGISPLRMLDIHFWYDHYGYISFSLFILFIISYLAKLIIKMKNQLAKLITKTKKRFKMHF